MLCVLVRWRQPIAYYYRNRCCDLYGHLQGHDRSNPSTSPPSPPQNESGDGGGGGCTLDRTGTGDALLPALFLVVIGLLLWRTTRRMDKADRT